MTELDKRPVRSYILRQGRLTKYQESGIKKFASKYTIPFQKIPINFDQIFSNKNKIILEIGFGTGLNAFITYIESLKTAFENMPDSST